MNDSREFRTKYGPWALVAGGSFGIGRAFAEVLAERGLRLILIALEQDELDKAAEELQSDYGVEVETVEMDLATSDLRERLDSLFESHDIGITICNAAYTPIGSFHGHSLDEKLRALDVNCRAPLILSHLSTHHYRQRASGGLVLMASLTGLQGTAWVTTYAATKAFNLVLAEGLWDELGGDGIDVLACVPGITMTPSYVDSDPKSASRLAPPPMDAKIVATEALDALGRRPSHVTGLANRVVSFGVQRLLPRKAAVKLFGHNLWTMYGHRSCCTK